MLRKKNLIKKSKQFFHSFMMLVTSLQMCLFSLPVFSQPIAGSGNIMNEGQRTGPMLGNIAMAAIDQGVKAYQMAQQQSFAQMQQATMYSQLAPQTQYDKYFGCPIPQSQSAFVENACVTPFSSPQDVSTSQTLQTIAGGYADYYGKLSNPAQNSRVPIGIQCLDNARRKLMEGQNNKINQLKELRANLEKAQQQFRDDQQQMLSDMNDLKEELRGRPQNSAGDANMDYLAEIGEECNNILSNLSPAIGPEVHTKMGFAGFQEALTRPSINSGNFTRNKKNYEKDINTQISKIQSDIDSDGIGVWMQKAMGQGGSAYFSSISVGQTKFKGINRGIQNHYADLLAKQNSAISAINTVDPSFASNLSNIDQNFMVDLNDFADNAELLYKKEYVKNCVSRNDYGLGLSSKAILESLYQPRALGQETSTLTSYRRALKGILDDTDTTVTQKKNKIANLDKEFNGSIQLRYETETTKQASQSPYDYFNGFVTNCEIKYQQDDTYAPGSGGIGARSQMTKVKRAVASIKNIQSELNQFKEKITNQIMAQLNHCEDRPLKAGSCSPDMVDPSYEDFCISHANQCAEKIKACYVKVNGSVQTRQNRLNQIATSYNDKVENFVANQEQILQQIRSVVGSQAQFLSQYFESVPFRVTDNMYIKMPEIGEDLLGIGVKLRGGGNLDFLAQLDDKLLELQGSIADQTGKLESDIGDENSGYIGNILGQLQTNQQDWADLKMRCAEKEIDYRNSTNEYNQEGQAAQSEIDGKVSAFCSLFGRLANVNPGPGCEGDNSPSDLYGKMSEIAGHIDPSVRTRLSQYENLCSRVNNDGDEDADDSDEIAPLLRECLQHKTWDGVYKELAKNYINQVPRLDRDDEAILDDLLGSDIGKEDSDFSDLSEDFQDSKYGEYANALYRIKSGTVDPTRGLAGETEEEANRNKIIAANAAKREPFDKSKTDIKKAAAELLNELDRQHEVDKDTHTVSSDGIPSSHGEPTTIKTIGEFLTLLQKDSLYSESENPQEHLKNKGVKFITDYMDQLNAKEKELKEAHETSGKTTPYAPQLEDEVAKVKVLRELLINNNLDKDLLIAEEVPELEEPEKKEGNDICKELRTAFKARQEAIEDETLTPCKGTSDRDKCINRESRNLEEDLDGINNSDIKRRNRTLRVLASTALDEDVNLREWRNIGEQNRGTCQAESNAQRNTGGFDPNYFMKMFGTMQGQQTQQPLDFGTTIRN